MANISKGTEVKVISGTHLGKTGTVVDVSDGMVKVRQKFGTTFTTPVGSVKAI